MAVLNGTIKRLVSGKGFGFILASDGNEYFFHNSACGSTRFDELREGQAVTFERGQEPNRLAVPRRVYRGRDTSLIATSRSSSGVRARRRPIGSLGSSLRPGPTRLVQSPLHPGWTRTRRA